MTLWQWNNSVRAADPSALSRILKIQLCFSEYFLQFLPDSNIVHFRFLYPAFQRCVHTIHFIPYILWSNTSKALVRVLSHICVSTFKYLEDEFGFILLFIKAVHSLPPVLYLYFPKGDYTLPILNVFPNTFMLVFFSVGKVFFHFNLGKADFAIQ